MNRLENKVAFVTGAARGQGRSHAVKLAEEGADIIAIDICEQVESVPFDMADEEDLAETERLVKETGRRVFSRKADVRDHPRLEEVLGEGVGELGRLDIVCANAGIGSFGAVEELTSQTWQDMIDINETGVWATAKAAIPHIEAHGEGGSIVLTSSAAGLHGMSGLAHYVTAKHGVVGLMRALAIELGPRGIRVNSIHPTQVNTPMLLNDLTYRLFCPELTDPTQEDMATRSEGMHVLPAPWVEPIDISNAVVFLCSAEGRFITGVALPVDCGADLIG